MVHVPDWSISPVKPLSEGAMVRAPVLLQDMPCPSPMVSL